MKKLFTSLMVMALSVSTFAQDPNFHIYLAFGQSNMEGNARIEEQDKVNVPERFKMMAAVNFSNPQRTKGQWYTAVPPLCRQSTGLTPCDYFGRKMVENLPENITVGVINVALGGCSIKMFDEDGLEDHIKQQADWLQNYAAQYNNNPFRTLMDLAKKAQKKGVIKGILLHQGCTDNMQSWWPSRVKLIYERMLKELNLSAEEVPLLVGELLSKEVGGSCNGHNATIAQLPNYIKHCLIISSKDCPQAGDGLHFNAEGYRMMGRRYADAMLKFLADNDANAEFCADSLYANTTKVTLTPGLSREFTLYATDKAGKSYNVTRRCTFTFDDPSIVSVNQIHLVGGATEGSTTVHATFTDKDGNTVTTDIKVNVSILPLTADGINPSIVGAGTFTEVSKQLKTGANGLGGWQYSSGIDLSAYKYLVINLRLQSTAKPKIRIYDSKDLNGNYYEYEMKTNKVATIDLQNMVGVNGKPINNKTIYTIAITTDGTRALYLTSVFLSDDGVNPTAISTITTDSPRRGIYDLQGRQLSTPRKGINIINGKKVIVK